MSQFTQAWVDAQNAKRTLTNKPQDAYEGLESELHGQVAGLLKEKRLYFVHSRCDKRTTQGLGTPDFIVALPAGKTLWIELKRKGGKLRQEQQIARHLLLALGHHHLTAYNLTDVKHEIETITKP